MTEFLEFLA